MRRSTTSPSSTAPGSRAPWAVVRDTRGTSVIELAIIAPLFIFLILAVVDFAMGYAAFLRLEDASARTVEKASAMFYDGTGFNALRQEAATASGQPIANVTLDSWVECNGTRQTTVTTVCASGEQVARYLTLQITGAFKPMFDYSGLASRFGGQGLGNQVILTGDAAVRLQ